MSQEDAIQVLRKMYAEGIDITTPQATTWLRKNMRNLGIINPASIIRTAGRESSVIRFNIGRMYLFGYDPKTKDDLLYYDLFPLILLLQYTDNGFLGLNLHYLDHISRQAFFDNLVKYLNDEEFDKNPKAHFDISYPAIKASKQLAYYKPTIKRYYYENIRTKVTEVPPIYWKFMLFLPLERFKNQIKENVWKDSKRKI